MREQPFKNVIVFLLGVAWIAPGGCGRYTRFDQSEPVYPRLSNLSLSPNHPLAPPVQMRLTELTEVPEDTLTSEKGMTKVRDIHLTEEWIELPSVIFIPPTPPLFVPVARGAPRAPGFSFPHGVCIESEGAHGRHVGSGFVVGAGYILISGHQANRAERLIVHFKNGARYPASIISVSDALDLSLLQIPFKETEPMPFASSEPIPVGEPVMAIGCPFGLDHSVAQGIISAPERILGNRPVLQTDVAINPGNSGGPLLNNQGEVVGVILGILAEARGIAFALPIREVKRFMGETFFQMGMLLAEEKRYPETADLLEQSLRFWPQSDKTHNNLGEAYRRMNKTKKAEQAYLMALVLNPQYADAHFNLGTFYDTVIHDFKKATQHYKQYLALQPTSPEAVRVAQRLKALENSPRIKKP